MPFVLLADPKLGFAECAAVVGRLRALAGFGKLRTTDADQTGAGFVINDPEGIWI
jgi:hypothetical protein